MPNSYLDTNGLKHYTDKLKQELQTNAAGVTSFNGRNGEVLPVRGDYTVSMITGAVPNTRTINGKTLDNDITINAEDIGVSTPDLSGYVPTTRTVNGKALSSNITLNAADIGVSTPDLSGYVPTTRTVNGKALSSNITLRASDVSALPISGGTLTGDLRIKGSGNSGTKINLGDSDYVHISEPETQDDCLEIKAKKVNFVLSDTTNTKFTVNGENPFGSSGSSVGQSIAGKSVKPTSDTTVTAQEGAEIFNDYSARTYDGTDRQTGNVASGKYAHAEGSVTTATGDNSHAEGWKTEALGEFSHAEGSATHAIGQYAHTEGWGTTASAMCSHAEGEGCVASAYCSHASGCETIARGMFQTVIGCHNVENDSQNCQLIAGDGAYNARSTCFRVTTNGIFASGSYNSSGADYAELFEWLDGNINGEDRVGLFVTLDGEYIRLANSGDNFILGIVSGNPSVVGNVYDDQWQGMYLYDIYGRPLWEDIEVPDKIIEEPDPENPGKTITRVLIPAHIEHRKKLNPNYDNTQTYIPRTQRKEWACIGMLGKLVARDDGSCKVNEYVKAGENGKATRSESKTKFRVMSRIDENHIRLLILQE